MNPQKEVFNWQEISPEGFTETIKGKVYKFGIYTIADSIYFENKYGPLSIMEMLAKKPTEFVFEVAWRCMDDKTDFPTFESFVKKITPREANKMELANKVMALMGICLQKKIVGLSEEENPGSSGEGFRKKNKAK